MKKEIFTKHICLWFLTYLLALQVVTSRWVVAWLQIPGIVSKLVTLALYLPFLLFIALRFVRDVKNRKLNLFKVLYYSFFLYYCLLFAYRLFAGMEVKDNFYYTAICLGCFALFSLIMDGDIKINGAALINDLCIFSLVVIAYWVLFNVVLKPYVYYSPINEIAIGGCVTILFPACVRKLWDCKEGLRSVIFNMVLVIGLLLIVFTLGSRAIFVTVLGEAVLLLLLCLKNKKVIAKYAMSVVLAVAVVAGLFALDVGEVRYAVYRETGFVVSWDEDSANRPNEGVQNRPSEQINAQEQIGRSDMMRADLSRMSIERIKENVLFGTGDVFYDYFVAGEVFAAPAHNFIFATMNCYGLIGLLLLMGLVVCTLFRIGAFWFRQKEKFHLRIFVFVTLIVFFGVGLIQATVYDMMVMPTMFVALAGYALDMMHKEG